MPFAVSLKRKGGFNTLKESIIGSRNGFFLCQPIYQAVLMCISDLECSNLS